MTALMRQNLNTLVRRASSANAGLLVQRGLSTFEEGGEKPIEEAHLNRIVSVKPDELYKQALDRWLLTTQGEHFDYVTAKINGRMMMGLALGGALETGVITQHSYGMPMIPASSVKGVVRDYFERSYGEFDKQKGVFTLNTDWQKVADVVFGSQDDSNPDAGYIIWHDAWWLPELTKEGEYSQSDKSKPFALDIVTVHHQDYYSGKSDLMTALNNTESPIPNQQLAVQGGFYFALEGDKSWVAYAKKLLQKALAISGLGAKGASGYGYFDIAELAKPRITKLFLGSKPIDTNDPYARVRIYLTSLEEAGLIEALSKGLNKLLTKFELSKDNIEDKQAISAIVQEIFPSYTQWETSNSSNTVRAFKFINDNK